MPGLTVAVAQPPCAALDVAANALAHAAAVRAAGARLVVFPELSLTGYELEAPELAADDPRLAPLVAACAATGSIALAGAPVAGPFIATLAVDGSGGRIVYRKQLPSDGERRRFRPGPAPAVLDVDGWRIGLAICRENGNAEHVAATAALGIDVYAAGVVDVAADDVVMEQRSQRIATAYGVWVAVASFAGPTGGGFAETAGRSGIWSPTGEVVDRADRAPGGLARATVG